MQKPGVTGLLFFIDASAGMPEKADLSWNFIKGV